ncbi:MAG: hypothetical protein ACM3S1_05710 [Hyphomicrobiales bacterium]
MQPFDWQVSAMAAMDDNYREMRRVQLESEAMRLPRMQTRLSIGARVRVFLTGRIDALDLAFEPLKQAR